jgi:hypothetical protein
VDVVTQGDAVFLQHLAHPVEIGGSLLGIG